MRTESDFLEWLQGISIYVGWDRYGALGGGFVCVSAYNESEELANAVDNLDAGDDEASNAADCIISFPYAWYASNANPAIAMLDLVDKIRNYYFNELNKEDE